MFAVKFAPPVEVAEQGGCEQREDPVHLLDVARGRGLRQDGHLVRAGCGLVDLLASVHPAHRLDQRLDHRLLEQRFLGRQVRSEEHTSELQSLMRSSYAVFCLNKKTDKQAESTHFYNILHRLLEE